jgi:hypothetical protein
MLAGVYPCGLEIGAPPDLVSVGPVLPCGWVTFLLGFSSVCRSGSVD